MIFYGIGAMVLVGVSWTIFGYVMGKAPRQDIKIPYLMIFSSLLAFAVSVLIGLFIGFPKLTPFGYGISFGVLVLSGIINYFQLDFMSLAMQKGPNGIIWSIIQSGFVFPFFMGVVFFDVPVNLLRIIGLVSLLSALVLFGVGKNNNVGGSWKLLAFGAFIATGLSQMLSNLPSYFQEAQSVHSVWRTAAVAVGMGLGAVIREIPRGKSFFSDLSGHCRRIRVWNLCFLLEMPELAASFLLLYPGMDILAKAGIGSVAYPTMVGSCIIAFELFAVLILREKRNIIQWIALALCLGGVVGICY